MRSIKRGSPRPLGAIRTSVGVNFAVFSRHATRVEVCVWHAKSGPDGERFDLPGCTQDVWHGLLPLSTADCEAQYVYYVHGPQDLENGHRFNAGIALIDPYARAITGSADGALADAAPAQGALRCKVVSSDFDWGSDKPPSILWRDTVLYELHVKGFTQLHPGVPEAWRGKYLGLTAAPVIEHLKAIGVTAVELLPCQSFVSEQFLSDHGLHNYWGYNTVAWFSPENKYAVKDAVLEFKTMVKALHAAGIEVILDMVFNHTAEGNEAGPTLSLRGLDNSIYYRLLPNDKRYYENMSGCGNTLNCEQDNVWTLVIDCLKYWAEEMHVDGFRFDLATVLARDVNGFNEDAVFFTALRAEPALAYLKMIAEPWDVGLGGYQLGRFPAGWSEWNDRYRDTLRGFWRRDAGTLGELAERMAGSSDVFRLKGRKPTASINFLTSHDGFTLHDLVAYSDKHNEANLEHGADGSSHNLSWNCGLEGPTTDAAVNALRGRQMRNFLASLFLSQGIPMLQAGDEFARTQAGNNNAYCQDNEISWVDWQLLEQQQELVKFVQLLTEIRRDREEFRRETFLKGVNLPGVPKDVSWLHARGGEMSLDDWQDASLLTLGLWFGKNPRQDQAQGATQMLILLNAAPNAVEFKLPGIEGDSCTVRFDTARQNLAAFSASIGNYHMELNSVVLLEI